MAARWSGFIQAGAPAYSPIPPLCRGCRASRPRRSKWGPSFPSPRSYGERQGEGRGGLSDAGAANRPAPHLKRNEGVPLRGDPIKPRSGGPRVNPRGVETPGRLGSVEEIDDFGPRHRLTEEISLHRPGAQRPQNAHLVVCFHAFDDAAQLEVAAHFDHPFDDGATGIVRFDILDEAAVDLDLVDRKAADVAQTRIPGAEIIERNTDA